MGKRACTRPLEETEARQKTPEKHNTDRRPERLGIQGADLEEMDQMCIHSGFTNNPSPQCWSAAWPKSQSGHQDTITDLNENHESQRYLLNLILLFNTILTCEGEKENPTDSWNANSSLAILYPNHGRGRSNS